MLARATHACRRGAYGIHELQQVTSVRRELAGNGGGRRGMRLVWVEILPVEKENEEPKGGWARFIWAEEVQRREGHPPPWLRSGRVKGEFFCRAFLGEICEDALLVTFSLIYLIELYKCITYSLHTNYFILHNMFQCLHIIY